MPDDESLARALLAEALRRDPEERPDFLDRACAGKPALRHQIASLLDAHARSHSSDWATRTAARLTALPGSLDGTMLGPYVIRQEIGRGGMGIVYLADDTRLSRRVALKALSPALNRDADGRDRLRREARAAAALSHPGIATVFALEEIDSELYLACEYVAGQSLRALLESGPLPLGQVVDIGVQLARAMAAAHVNGIVHRDLKPENVVRTPSGAIKVLDFGLARMESQTSSRLTQAGTVLGTPAYMAPEQARGEPTDFRADIFSVGLVLYELASGLNPFMAPTVTATIARIVGNEPAPLTDLVPGVAPDLARIVHVCLRKDARQRYESTAQLVEDLETLGAKLSAERQRTPSGQFSSSVLPSHGPSTRAPLWWWQFHQLAASAIYAATMYPVWHVRRWLPVEAGVPFLFIVLICAVVAASLRLHLWFTSRLDPGEVSVEHARQRSWLRALDGVFAGVLFTGALFIGAEHEEFAMLLLTIAAAMVVATFVIEPATFRAALRSSTPARTTSLSRP